VAFRRRSGSSLCYACGKLNRVDAAVCFHCGARAPGLWGFGGSIGSLVRGLDWSRAVIVLCVVVYVASLLLDLPAAMRMRGVFNFLSPSSAALNALGMTGAYAWAHGRWWTLISAIYLHGGLLHLVFNLFWVRQLAPEVEELFGRSRLTVIFTAGGVVGFVVSDLMGVPFSVGASGAIFGLLGALVSYGRTRGGAFGVAIMRQYGHWALILFILGFLMPGVNNLAHAGGFVGGYLAGALLGSRERRPERPAEDIVASVVIVLTVASFVLALWTTFAR